MRMQSEKACGNGGWLHPLESNPIPVVFRPPVHEEPRINFTAHWQEWSNYTDFESVQTLAEQLGVSPLALRCLGAVWSGEYWAFPMRDEWENITGIQFRHSNGFKQTMRGSHVGYFIPDCPPQSTAFVTEGASDCASALTLGLFAVGKYNCAQSGARLGQYLRRKRVRDVVVVSDNDGPGILGAEKLAGEIHMHCCIYTPPAKDLRMAVSLGITKAVIDSTVSSLQWRQP